MQPTNKPSKQRSRCLYCGSLDRGKGCAYGPHKVHFHAGDDTKCSYCGSTDYGRGCKVNPISNLHMHGVNINDSLKIDVQAFLDKEFLMNELTKNFKDFEAFRLQIIDEHGNKIKQP